MKRNRCLCSDIFARFTNVLLYLIRERLSYSNPRISYGVGLKVRRLDYFTNNFRFWNWRLSKFLVPRRRWQTRVIFLKPTLKTKSAPCFNSRFIMSLSLSLVHIYHRWSFLPASKYRCVTRKREKFNFHFRTFQWNLYFINILNDNEKLQKSRLHRLKWLFRHLTKLLVIEWTPDSYYNTKV